MNTAFRYRRWTDKPAYAVTRMSTAIERLLKRRDECNNAGWAVAWAVAAGAPVPAYFRIRPGHTTLHDVRTAQADRRRDSDSPTRLDAIERLLKKH